MEGPQSTRVAGKAAAGAVPNFVAWHGIMFGVYNWHGLKWEARLIVSSAVQVELRRPAPPAAQALRPALIQTSPSTERTLQQVQAISRAAHRLMPGAAQVRTILLAYMAYCRFPCCC